MTTIKSILVSILLSVPIVFCQGQTLSSTVNWPEFMARQSLKWDNISTDYYSGMILGNGLLGTNIYKENDSSIRFDVGRTDVVDQRGALLPKVGDLYAKARLPIGYFSVKTTGKIIGAKMELDIYNAEAKGKVFTTAGEIDIHAFVVANQNVVYIKVTGLGKEPRPHWKWNPGRSISPRYLQSYPTDKPENFLANPEPITTTENGYTFCRQSLLNNGGYTTAYKIHEDENSSKLILSIGYDADSSVDESKEALNALKTFERSNESEIVTAHRNWWHHFYQQSFISLPDKRMENFYWIQLYKLASATRADKPMLDLMGPWTNPTPWPAIWWNLNVQLTYSPIFTANHLALGESLFKALNDNKQNLINNVPEKWRKDAAAIGRTSSYDLISPLSIEEIDKGNFEPANLTWALFYYYQYYAYSKDVTALRKNIFPLLKKSTNFLIHLLKKDEQGVYHFPLSYSPEYKSAEDANYTLSTLKWALSTLIKVNQEQKLKDKDEHKWVEILNNMAPFPADATGFLIGKDVALTSSHRHYSHMLMIYPYYLVNWDQPEQHEVIEKTLTHWLSLKGALQGYTFTGAAAMYASMGNGDKSYALLNELFDKYIQPNTLYRESGPVIETPLAAASAIQDLLMQSWGNKIRVFPAIPSTWKNLSFKQLRAEGAFLISADMQNGITENIEVNSLKGGSCVLVANLDQFVVSSNKRNKVAYTQRKEGSKTRIDIGLTYPGEVIRLTSTLPFESQGGNVEYIQYGNWSWGLNKK